MASTPTSRNPASYTSRRAAKTGTQREAFSMKPFSLPRQHTPAATTVRDAASAAPHSTAHSSMTPTEDSTTSKELVTLWHTIKRRGDLHIVDKPILERLEAAKTPTQLALAGFGVMHSIASSVQQADLLGASFWAWLHPQVWGDNIQDKPTKWNTPSDFLESASQEVQDCLQRGTSTLEAQRGPLKVLKDCWGPFWFKTWTEYFPSKLLTSGNHIDLQQGPWLLSKRVLKELSQLAKYQHAEGAGITVQQAAESCRASLTKRLQDPATPQSLHYLVPNDVSYVLRAIQATSGSTALAPASSIRTPGIIEDSEDEQNEDLHEDPRTEEAALSKPLPRTRRHSSTVQGASRVADSNNDNDRATTQSKGGNGVSADSGRRTTRAALVADSDEEERVVAPTETRRNKRPYRGPIGKEPTAVKKLKRDHFPTTALFQPRTMAADSRARLLAGDIGVYEGNCVGPPLASLLHDRLIYLFDNIEGLLADASDPDVGCRLCSSCIPHWQDLRPKFLNALAVCVEFGDHAASNASNPDATEAWHQPFFDDEREVQHKVTELVDDLASNSASGRDSEGGRDDAQIMDAGQAKLLANIA